MARYAYVNGRYLLHGEAAVHIEDRGYQFADGVYEVVTILNGKPVDEEPHLDRLARSLGELQIAWPLSRPVLKLICRELVARNGLRNGLVYMQITRGVAPRNHAFPAAAVKPALVMTTKRMNFARMRKFSEGVKVITVPDDRWRRRDIKTIGLLANCLGKQRAEEQGAYEAWQIDRHDGTITEGTSSNAWIVTADGELITRAADCDILNGITRQSILAIADKAGLKFAERPFDLAEAKAAREAFVSSATSFVTPVVRIDDQPVADGKPGPLCRQLLAAYREHAANSA